MKYKDYWGFWLILICLFGWGFGLFVWQFDYFEARLPLVPTVESQLTQVGHIVALVHDFQSYNGFDDVFEGDDALETAVFVDNTGDVAFVAEHGVPDFGHGELLAIHGYVAFDFAKGHVELVLGEQFKGLLSIDDIANWFMNDNIKEYPEYESFNEEKRLKIFGEIFKEICEQNN